jgi:hypothetical protein
LGLELVKKIGELLFLFVPQIQPILWAVEKLQWNMRGEGHTLPLPQDTQP